MTQQHSAQFVALDTQIHRELRLNTQSHFKHAAQMNLCGAGFTEIVSLSSCMPVVVMPGNNNSEPLLTAMLGLQEQQNLFYHPDGWLGHSVPLSIQCAPFNFASEHNKMIVLIDEQSELISRTGEPIFSADGTATPLLKRHQAMLADLVQGLNLNQVFIDTLNKHNLLSKLTITLTDQQQQQHSLDGCLTINENAMSQLSDPLLSQLHHNGMLMAINSMMLSLRQFNRLVQLSQNGQNPISHIKLSVAE